MNYKKILTLIAAAALLYSGCGKSSSGKTYPRFGEGDNTILSYSFTAQKNSALGADAAGTISEDTIEVTVPHGTNLKSLVAVFVTDSTDVTVNDVAQVSGETINDFSSDVVYEVTANDEVKTYTVKVTVAPSSEKTLSSFFLNGTEGTVDQSTGIINVSLAPKTSLTSLIASFDAVCKNVLIDNVEQISGVTANNFSGDVTYTVVAEDGTKAYYTVKTTVQKASTKEIGSFSFIRDNENNINTSIASSVTGIISGNEINIILPYGSTATDLIATFITTGEKVTADSVEQKSGESRNNFSSPVEYIVEAEDGSQQSYTVHVTIESNSAKSIVAFKLDGEPSVIDETSATITTEFPETKNIESLIASFITTGAAVTVNGLLQSSGVTINDFTSNPVYRVIAEDGSFMDYTVSITRNSSIAGVWNFDYTADGGYSVFEAVQVPVTSGYALQFDGYNDYVQVPDDPALTLSKSGSIEVMVYIIANTPYGGIVHKGVNPDFSDESFSLQYGDTPGTLRFIVTNKKGRQSWIDSDTELQPGKWYHLAATWDLDTGMMCIYIDGSLDIDGPITTGPLRDSDGALVIGAQLPVQYTSHPSWGNLGFNGLIDRVQLLSRALTPEEIADHYTAFKQEESGMTAYILKVTPGNKPLILTVLFIIAALVGGLWARNTLKHRKKA